MYETFSFSVNILGRFCVSTKGGEREVGMFTQRVKAALLCLGLEFKSEPGGFPQGQFFSAIRADWV